MNAVIVAEFPGASEEQIKILKIEARSLINAYLTIPPVPQSLSPDSAGWIMVRPDGDRGWSFQLANLVRANPLSPPGAASIAAAVGAASLQTAAAVLAFLTVLSTLAVRPVPRSEAMTLHLIHRICDDDRFFTLDELIAHAPSLAADYDVAKNSPTDIESYVKELARAGCISHANLGYRAEEKIWITPF